MCPTFLAPPSMPHDAARRTSTKAIHWSAWKRNSAKFARKVVINTAFEGCAALLRGVWCNRCVGKKTAP
jgi:hypothetical protein